MRVNIESVSKPVVAPGGTFAYPQQGNTRLNGHIAIFQDAIHPKSAILEQLRSGCLATGINCAIVRDPSELQLRPDLIILNWEHYWQKRDQVANYFQNPFSGIAERVPIILLNEGERWDPIQLKSAFEDGVRDVYRSPIQGTEFALRIGHILSEQIAQRDQKEEQHAVIKSLNLLIQKMTVRIEYVQKKLKQAQKRPGLKDFLPEIGKLVFELKHATPNDSSWKDHQRRTVLFDQGFTRALKWKHPALSPSELKYLCLVKQNLTRKEQADILVVSTAAIEKRRYRIKKKIGITGRMSLEKYVETIQSS
jgi:DNA-binding CsgD family transcriptional regulator